nr:ubiquitin hydrolase [Tanacetum cinerariifolium]
MVKTNSTSENKACCLKDCKKNTETLKSKITDLDDKLFDAKNLIYHYKLALAQKLETLKEEKEGVDGKLAGLLTASKDLDNLIESQRSDKNKEGLGYSDVPPPPAQLYLSPKKDLSWTDLPECADDTITNYSRPSPTVESTSGDDQNRNPYVYETIASPITPKPFIKKPSKKSTVRGNRRNWNNLKSKQLGENFVRKNMACFNCGHFDHLSYNCGLGVKMGRSSPKNNYTHRTHSYDRRPFQETTQNLVAMLIQRVKRLERELKARTPIQKVDRGRSRPAMAWVPKKEVIEFGDSYEVPTSTTNTTTTDTTSGETSTKSGRTVTLTAEDMQKKKNDVKASDSQSKSKIDETITPKKSPVKKRVKRGTTRTQNNTYKSPTHKHGVHRPHEPPMRPMRSNMNGARPIHLSINLHIHIQTDLFKENQRNFPTASRKFPTGSTKFSTADMGMKGKAGSSQNKIDDKRYWDSGCSRHMTGNISYLSDYEPFDRGYVSLGKEDARLLEKELSKSINLSLKTCTL